MVATRRAAMDAANAKIVIQDFLKDIHSRPDEAATVAKAAEACANAGNVKKAVEIALDVD
jgi:hypothetical protein